ncbi:mycofactocin precursor MftA [Mycobacterium botniense]|uniref:Mycofactocin n=1 Tax=Mycobacterium botniense TaxID=84962 RepID=A0A7I9XT18_9MYCO|nr:mycofactocin precursor MftA [Mycobacterium botniense]GFG73133.1 hypothetical protein MBOT_04980 [Mycobacterium botniense]
MTKGIFMDQRTQTGTETQQHTGAELVSETLVEEVSIDGMCGVY